jgi:4-alpha-glucanotransferase
VGFHTGRHAGVLIPLFAIPSRSSWGIGEIPDLPRLARWLSLSGLDFVQLLPINEMDQAHNSPYAATSAMSIDPLFVCVDDLPEFRAAGGEPALQPEAREALAAARGASRLNYDAVRTAKNAALAQAFAWFDEHDLHAASARGGAFQTFAARERAWLDDYALFRALHDESGGEYWRDWPRGERDRRDDALDEARRRLARQIRYYAYIQWVAQEQWLAARQACRPVGIFGDFPFMVSGHSADVWARQHEFRHDASIGTPPDAASPVGQDWGLPAYRWDVSAAGGYAWLRQRAERCAALFDGFRVDHVAGFFRTFVRERDGAMAFVPADEADQRRQGRSILQVLLNARSRITAEDLGDVPGFVRESMADLRVPGLKVLRWERRWDEPRQPFRDPRAYPRDSVATTGTHDTDTLAGWWDAAGLDDRRSCAGVSAMADAGLQPEAPFSPAVRDALLRGVFASGADFVLLPIQDVFGWRDRINDPSAAAGNWTWRLPWPVEDLLAVPEGRERANFLRSISPPACL